MRRELQQGDRVRFRKAWAIQHTLDGSTMLVSRDRHGAIDFTREFRHKRNDRLVLTDEMQDFMLQSPDEEFIVDRIVSGLLVLRIPDVKDEAAGGYCTRRGKEVPFFWHEDWLLHIVPPGRPKGGKNKAKPS